MSKLCYFDVSGGMKDQFHLHTVIQLARLYGVVETLHTLRPRSCVGIAALILSWADKYTQSGEGDLSSFFIRAVAPEYVE